MKKFISIFFVFSIFFCSYTQAQVRSIIDSDNSVGYKEGTAQKIKPNQFKEDPRAKCRQKGFNRTACPPDHYPIATCPHDPTMYNKCCSNEFRYTAEQCVAKGKAASEKTCNDLHKCL